MATAQREYYDAYWSDQGFQPHENLSAPLRDLYEAVISKDAACLDVGCGSGTRSGGWITQHTGKYVGVDVSETAVAPARARGLDARLIGDAASLPFPDEHFDVIVCIEVLEHLFRPDEAVREFRRVLRPGGLVIATVPNALYWRRRSDSIIGRWHPGGDDLSVREPWRDPHIRFFGPTTLARMFRHGGFDNLDVAGFGGGFFSALPYLRRLKVPSLSRLYDKASSRWPGMFASTLCVIACRR